MEFIYPDRNRGHAVTMNLTTSSSREHLELPTPERAAQLDAEVP